MFRSLLSDRRTGKSRIFDLEAKTLSGNSDRSALVKSVAEDISRWVTPEDQWESVANKKNNGLGWNVTDYSTRGSATEFVPLTPVELKEALAEASRLRSIRK